MIVSIYIKGVKLDLYKDENIVVNSSVANIQDITKNQTDLTKTFTVPASLINNKLFKHYYDADIDNSFDARIKVDGEIKLDGLPFRIGKFRLSKVSVKKGKPSAYTINFWGNLLEIKDKVGKDYISNLDLTEFDHAYNSANVKTGLESSLFGGDLVYNLLVKKQYYYNSNPSDTTTTDALVNIGYGDGSGSNGIDFLDLRPSLRLIKIIEAIETDYNIEFSRQFFGLTEFTNIFTWLNPSKDTKAGGGIQTVDFDGGDSDHVNFATNIGSFYVNNTSAVFDNFYWKLLLSVTPDIGYENIPYTVRIISEGNILREESLIGNDTFYHALNTEDAPELPYTWNVILQIETSQEFKYTTNLRQREYRSGSIINTYNTTSSINTIGSNFIIENQLPKIKIIDFLKGIFKMFKLIVIPKEDGTTYVDTLKNYYANGKLTNVTKYIDFESYDVERGKILNEINFLFKEPTTILNTTFEENTNIAYGDEETILKNDDGEVLDGDTLEFTLPFETVLFERLNDINDNTQANVQYGAIIDESLEPVNPDMVLFYNILQPLNGNELGFIDDNGVKQLLNSSINTPSHTDTFDSPNFSLLFGAEFSTWSGEKINNTLYKNYYENYILSIFNVKKRSFKYNAILPLNVMLGMQLNDTLQIKNQFFKIDNFNTNLITGKVSLNLVNSFDTLVNNFSIYPASFIVEDENTGVSSSVTNDEGSTFNIIDVGDGIGWISVTQKQGQIFIDILKGDISKDRFVQIEFSSTKTKQKEIIYIQQKVKSILSSSNTVTSDNNIITSDNNG